MSKKTYFILSPANSTDQVDQLKKSAELYFGTKNYEEVSGNLLTDAMKELSGDSCNRELLLIGLSTTLMSKSDAVYVAKDWEQDDVCKICHMLAFSHGIDIVYEIV